MASSAGDDMTLGEVARNLEALAKQVERGFERIDERFNTLAMVHADVYLADRAADRERRKADIARLAALEQAAATKADEGRVENVVERVKKIENNLSWLGRAVASAVLLGIVTVIVAASGFPH